MYFKSNLDYFRSFEGNLSIEQFGNLFGFGKSKITTYFSGKTKPSVDFLLELKDRYKISIDDILLSDLNKTKPLHIPEIDIEKHLQISEEKYPERLENYNIIKESNITDEGLISNRDMRLKIKALENTLTVMQSSLAKNILDVESLLQKKVKAKS